MGASFDMSTRVALNTNHFTMSCDALDDDVDFKLVVVQYGTVAVGSTTLSTCLVTWYLSWPGNLDLPRKILGVSTWTNTTSVWSAAAASLMSYAFCRKYSYCVVRRSTRLLYRPPSRRRRERRAKVKSYKVSFNDTTTTAADLYSVSSNNILKKINTYLASNTQFERSLTYQSHLKALFVRNLCAFFRLFRQSHLLSLVYFWFWTKM